MTGTATIYRITAATADGVDASTPEVLGDAYGRYYPTLEAAESAAIDLEADEDGDVTYTPEPVRLEIRGVELREDAGTTTVTAVVDSIPSEWTVVTASGPDGWQPSGSGVEEWADHSVIDRYGWEAAAAIGSEVIALARSGGY